ncbi:MAG TPA: ABC transporter substrate-binding protein [Acidimicrobiales bacterium]|nr:ABC transporter substrate-binding protein [Acidimicrobiales bacterium]
MMDRRTFLKAMGGAAGALVLGSACNPGRPATVGGRPTVRVKSWGDLGSPSPFIYVAGPGYWRMSLLFDTLTWPDSTGEQLPWLASSYHRSDDGLVWSVQLRDVKWADGMPLTSRDVAFTYDYYTSRIFTPLLTGVPRKGIDVRVTGDRSVEFRLQSPDATFLQQTLGTMPIAPEHVFSKIADPQAVFDKRVFMGSGAYRLASKDVNADTESYVARDDYYLGRPYVRRIEMVGVPNDDELAGLRAGVLDGGASAAEGVRNEVLAPFRDNPEFGLISAPAGFAFPLFFNMTRGGALADLRFRQACLHAIDRNDMVGRLLTGNGEAGSPGWLPPSNPYYTSDGVREYPFDRTEAARLLDEGGYRRLGSGDRVNPDGSPLHFRLHLPDVVPLALAELVVDSLGAVGISIDLQRIDLVHVYGLKVAPNYDLIIQSYPGPAGIGPNADPDQLRAVFHSNPPSQTHKATGYSNPEVDRLIDAQLATYDIDERKKLVAQIQQIVAQDLPVAMLYYTDFFYAFRRSVFDQWYYTPGGFSTGLSDVYNKQPYITGRKVGVQVRD